MSSSPGPSAKTIALVGLSGVGKSSVGRRLATGLDRRDGHRADARAIAGRLERCAAKSLDSLPKAWHRFQKVKPFWE